VVRTLAPSSLAKTDGAGQRDVSFDQIIADSASKLLGARLAAGRPAQQLLRGFEETLARGSDRLFEGELQNTWVGSRGKK